MAVGSFTGHTTCLHKLINAVQLPTPNQLQSYILLHVPQLQWAKRVVHFWTAWMKSRTSPAEILRSRNFVRIFVTCGRSLTLQSEFKSERFWQYLHISPRLMYGLHPGHEFSLVMLLLANCNEHSGLHQYTMTSASCLVAPHSWVATN